MSTTMRWHGEPTPPPASISEHISSAVDKIPGLTGRQRNAVHAAMVTLCRDISFVKMIAGQVSWSHQAPADEGRPL
jgi:hypothetical protein